MRNNKPFDIILDSYNKESFSLYVVVSSLFDYPSIGENEDLEGKLYASAFAYLCSNYLNTLIDFYEHDDFELFIEEMGLIEHIEELIKIHEKSDTIEWEPEDHSELIWAVIQDYQVKIAKDVNTVFHTQKLKICLFSSIFNMDQNEFHPLLSLDAIDFFDSKFENI